MRACLTVVCVALLAWASTCQAESKSDPIPVTFAGGGVKVHLPGEAQPRALASGDMIPSGTRIIAGSSMAQLSFGRQILLCLQAGGSFVVLEKDGRLTFELPEKVKLRVATRGASNVLVRPRSDVTCEPGSNADFIVDSIGETVIGGAIDTSWEIVEPGASAGRRESLKVAMIKYFPFPIGGKREVPREIAKADAEKLAADFALQQGDRVIRVPTYTLATPSGSSLGNGAFGMPGVDDYVPPEDITP
jgi:hypothetical protein